MEASYVAVFLSFDPWVTIAGKVLFLQNLKAF